MRLRAWAGLFLVAAGALAGIAPLRDFDTFHHLALGRDIVTRGFGQHDPFLFPVADHVGTPMPYWLGSVIVYLFQSAFGGFGPALYAAVAGSLLCGLLWWTATRRDDGWADLAAAALPLLLLLPVLRVRSSGRPELLGYAALAFTMLALARHRDGHRRMLFMLPIVMALWSNVHMSVALGLGVVALELCARGFSWRLLRSPRPTPRPLLELSGVLLLGVAATATNPSPYAPVQSAVRFALATAGVAAGPADPSAPAPERVLPLLRHAIAELQPMSWRDLAEPAGLLGILALVSLLAAGRRALVRDAALLASAAILAALASRFALPFAVLAVPIIARQLRVVISRVPRGAKPLGIGLAVLSFAAVPLLRADGAPLSGGVAPHVFPARATAYLRSLGDPGRVFDTFHFGGYLEWQLGIQVYQDGRGLLPAGFEEASIQYPPRDPRFAPIDQRYRFDALVLGYPVLEAAHADTLKAAMTGDWLVDRERFALVAFDDGGMLYLRRDGRHAEAARRDEYRHARPGNVVALMPDADRAGLAQDLERSLRETPTCRICRVQLGVVLLGAGDLDGAGRVLDEALVQGLATGGPRGLRAATQLARGRVDERRGELGGAERRYRTALALAGDPAQPRGDLARVLFATNRAEEAHAVLAPNLAAKAPSERDLMLAIDLAQARGRGAEAAALRRRLDERAAIGRAEALFQDGVRHTLAGQPDEAMTAYRSSLELRENAAARSNLGYLHLDRGELDAAIAEQRRALALAPDHAEAHFGLGLALRQRGDAAGARAAFRRFLELRPRGTWSLEAEKHLAALPR